MISYQDFIFRRQLTTDTEFLALITLDHDLTYQTQSLVTYSYVSVFGQLFDDDQLIERQLT
jgi:hypothetical protein